MGKWCNMCMVNGLIVRVRNFFDKNVVYLFNIFKMLNNI